MVTKGYRKGVYEGYYRNRELTDSSTRIQATAASRDMIGGSVRRRDHPTNRHCYANERLWSPNALPFV